ncbi:L,D-transpeptidase catalytic domain [Pedobacter terrae]|uniref:L,D-transpeptidase catalytic domain n=1 Tax=Pedobacter terrae TaxID=405671 RepID=A0A1G7VQV6_9SPHI|nr:L,D-transpeptidase family protein [Pedobacter terrae]SDG62206.1 L,D-transpeptidase catalytic domain [Pedobacter terrae]
MKKIILFIISFFIIGAAIYNLYPEQKLPTNTEIDYIIVKKSDRQLLAYAKHKLIKTYKISLGDSPVGHKEFEGDEKTPEGFYIINAKNPNSGYHKNLGVSYPNKEDIAKAKALDKLPGGDIKIHGIRNKLGFIGKFQRFFDWTNGCMALTNNEVDELFYAVNIGTKIEIRP